MAKYPEMKFTEVAKNAIALVIVNIIDILVLNAFLAAIAIVLIKISSLLIIVILPGIAIELAYRFYKKMLARKSITYLLFNLEQQ